MKKSWFYRAFGFQEQALGSFSDVRKKFELIVHAGDVENTILRSKANGKTFVIGVFETPSVEELHKQVEKSRTTRHPNPSPSGLTFKNIIGDVRALILDPRNEGAVFQAASQFNCLEMIGPRVTPEMGVTCYCLDKTQGPICAIACPAATIIRSYFAGREEGRGQARGNQLNMMKDVAQLLGNTKHKYWVMRNGYLLPTNNFKLRVLQSRLVSPKACKEKLSEKITQKLRVGVHWNTETEAVGKDGKKPHCVCQVFTSALPIAYVKGTFKRDWEQLAVAVLNGAFEATLAVGAVLAAKRGRRVPVYLTCVGGGVFGNAHIWIVSAIKRALKVWKDAPLDVRLVHYKSIPGGAYKTIGTPTTTTPTKRTPIKRKRSSLM